LVGTITKEQTAEAERFNNELAPAAFWMKAIRVT
jgi:hypothetical protein